MGLLAVGLLAGALAGALLAGAGAGAATGAGGALLFRVTTGLAGLLAGFSRTGAALLWAVDADEAGEARLPGLLAWTGQSDGVTTDGNFVFKQYVFKSPPPTESRQQVAPRRP